MPAPVVAPRLAHCSLGAFLLPSWQPVITQGLTAYQVRLDTGQATLYPSFYNEELEPE
jgi:hypothetical protein